MSIVKLERMRDFGLDYWERQERVMTYMRRMAQLSQLALARKTGIPQPRVSHFEHGLEMPEYHALLILRLFSNLLQTDIVPPEGMTAAEFLQAPASLEMKRYISKLVFEASKTSENTE